MRNPVAVWTIALDVKCPHCAQLVDLLGHPDFWKGRAQLTPGEHDTAQTTGMCVECPSCQHAFNVDVAH